MLEHEQMQLNSLLCLKETLNQGSKFSSHYKLSLRTKNDMDTASLVASMQMTPIKPIFPAFVDKY